MHKNRRITLHQKIGKGIKFNYITSKNTLKFVSGIQNVIIYVGTVIRKEKAHKHRQIFPVTAWVGGGLPTGWPGLPTGGQGSKVYVLCAEPKEHTHSRPGTRPGGSATRPGGSVTGVTEKLFMCQMFMCLFRPPVKIVPTSGKSNVNIL